MIDPATGENDSYPTPGYVPDYLEMVRQNTDDDLDTFPREAWDAMAEVLVEETENTMFSIKEFCDRYEVEYDTDGDPTIALSGAAVPQDEAFTYANISGNPFIYRAENSAFWLMAGDRSSYLGGTVLGTEAVVIARKMLAETSTAN